MATAQMLYAETTTDVTASGTGTWVDAATIAAASFTANKKYLVIAVADLAGSGAAAEHHVRLVYGTTPTEFTDGDFVLDPGSGADGGTIASWMHVYTQPGTTDLIKLQIQGEGTNTATCKFSQIFALNLDDFGTENTDYWYNEVTADATTTTSAVAGASVTLTPNGTDDFIAIGHIVQGIPSAVADGNFFQAQLYESVGGTTAPSLSVEAEDADAGDEQRNWILSRYFAAPSNASHTWSVRYLHAGASFTVLSSRIIVLRLNKCQQWFGAYTDGAISPAGSGSWTTVATGGINPTTTGNWFVLATATGDMAVATAELNIRLQNDNGGSLVSDPNYGDDAPNTGAWDANDDIPLSIFKMMSLTTGATRTFNYDMTRAVSTPDAKHRNIIGFSAELAASGGIALAGTPASVETVSGHLIVSIPVAGASSGVESVAGAVDLAIPMAGIVAGVQAATGDLSVAITLQGNVAPVEVVNGHLLVDIPLQVSVSGTETTSGHLVLDIPLAGNVSAVSSVTGDLTVSAGGGAIALDGSVASVSIVSGTADVAVGLEGLIAAGATVTGTLDVTAAPGTVTGGAAARTHHIEYGWVQVRPGVWMERVERVEWEDEPETEMLLMLLAA